MFGHRPDGKRVKNLDPTFKIMPFIMSERIDAQVYFKQDIPLRNLDEYIEKKAQEGIRLSYMNIIYAALIKIIAQKPNLNRFVVNGILYDRNKINVSLTIKKNLTEEGQETTIKLDFTGKENIFEVKKKLDIAIEKNKLLENSKATKIKMKLYKHPQKYKGEH